MCLFEVTFQILCAQPKTKTAKDVFSAKAATVRCGAGPHRDIKTSGPSAGMPGRGKRAGGVNHEGAIAYHPHLDLSCVVADPLLHLDRELLVKPGAPRRSARYPSQARQAGDVNYHLPLVLDG